MKKAIMSILTVWILVNVGLFSLIILSPEIEVQVSAVTIIVDDDGTPGVDCNYTTIQEGIDAASPGDTVFVKNGTYYENVVVNKTINLTGENRNTAIIDGGGSGTVLFIDMDWVNITGLKITNGTPGIWLNSSSNNIITNNLITQNKGDGIHLSYSNTNNITHNRIMYHWVDGIHLEFSNNNNITDNALHVNSEAAIFLLNSNDNYILNNNASFNDDNCIYLESSNGNDIIGNNASNTLNGIELYLSDSNVIHDNNISLNEEEGLRISYSHSNNITGNDMISNGRRGFLVLYSDENKIADNNISFNSLIGVYMRESSYNDFTNNIMVNDSIYIRGDQIEHWNSHNINISNTVNGKPVYYWKNQTGGIVPPGAGEVILANCTDIKVENQVLTKGSVGMQVAFSTAINVTGNNASSNGLYGIKVIYSNKTNISDNIASNNIYGITLSKSNTSNIFNNTASSNYYDGILLTYSDNNYIYGNTASNNEDGIYLDYSNTNNISGNIISQNLDDVLCLYGSNNNNITNNYVYSNPSIAIVLWESDGNNITRNHVWNNWYGIYLPSSSTENAVYHNNILYNENQAFDGTTNSNKWDNGYPSGGNYWSDYTGNDSFKGPNQNIPGSDGIGDTNYSIDSDSVDNYPLMNPIGNLTFLYEGWNLISIPFIQPDTNLESVLSSINGSCDAVQWFNASDSSDPWKHHHILKPSHLNDLTNIQHTIGFWIHITEPSGVLFEYYGTQPTSNQSIPLHPGWNMVGYPSLMNRNRTAALNNLTFGTEVDAIWTFDAATQTWEEIKTGDYFEVGKGYWIHAIQECVWEVGV